MGIVKHFAWSPDGQTLLFDFAQGDVRKVYQARSASGEVQLFTAFDSGEPAWSPDGKRVVVASQNGLHSVDSEGHDRVQLSSTPAQSPAWSADGSQIAYLANQTNAQGIAMWVMGADGTNQTRITESGVLRFAWSPISRRLAYITGQANDRNAVLYLWVTDLENPAKLIAEVNEADIAWTR
ncbi:MAG: hypothetical protein M3Q45_11935 [Chloroflexota bacterium]|nr:hypothetical protein [Chloroflexota bacterium]